MVISIEPPSGTWPGSLDSDYSLNLLAQSVGVTQAGRCQHAVRYRWRERDHLIGGCYSLAIDRKRKPTRVVALHVEAREERRSRPTNRQHISPLSRLLAVNFAFCA